MTPASSCNVSFVEFVFLNRRDRLPLFERDREGLTHESRKGHPETPGAVNTDKKATRQLRARYSTSSPTRKLKATYSIEQSPTRSLKATYSINPERKQTRQIKASYMIEKPIVDFLK